MIRFRPRFTIRTLAIFVTLVCVYFASWPLTKKYGVPKTTIYNEYVGGKLIWEGRSPAPFIVQQDEFVLTTPNIERYLKRAEYRSNLDMMNQFPNVRTRKYYLWLCGLKLQLPYETVWQF